MSKTASKSLQRRSYRALGLDLRWDDQTVELTTRKVFGKGERVLRADLGRGQIELPGVDVSTSTGNVQSLSIAPGRMHHRGVSLAAEKLKPASVHGTFVNDAGSLLCLKLREGPNDGYVPFFSVPACEWEQSLKLGRALAGALGVPFHRAKASGGAGDPSAAESVAARVKRKRTEKIPGPSKKGWIRAALIVLIGSGLSATLAANGFSRDRWVTAIVFALLLAAAALFGSISRDQGTDSE